MSDIYLQITETPTVVTLSAPVVSGALSSTVTVANTVTVALDSNSLSALENVTVTVGAAITGTVTVSNFPATQPVSIASVTIGNSVTISSLPAISGTVTADAGSGFPSVIYSGILQYIDTEGAIAVGINSALPAGTNRIGVVTIGAGTVTIGAGISQIGSVTASISGTVPVSISSVTIGNSVTIGSLPAISGTVTANAGNGFTTAVEVGIFDFISNEGVMPISGTVTANTFALQGTAVTTSNFTSTTASTVLAGYNATREVLSIFNEGAGNLHICAGATCTTIAYQVRLSAGDYYEVPNHQTTITHSAVFATAGTARVTQVS